MRARGVTILETMIAMVVLAIGLVGALAAFQAGAVEARLGQHRQMKMMLADAALQRIRLQNRATFFSGLPPQPTVNLATVPVGTGPWVLDPTSTTDPLDFSQGAYFKILPDGTITPVSIAGSPSCASATVPEGTICREVFTHLGGPYNASPVGAYLPSAARSATAWVRVTRKTSATDPTPAEVDVLLNTVVVQ